MDQQKKIIQWENLEDFNKFIQDIDKVKRDSIMWPSVPLEIEATYLEVNVTRQTTPRTVEEETFKKEN